MRRGWMLTFTYRENGMWSAKHITESVRAFRRWCDRESIECLYEWVMELTKQGRPHYHMVVWLPHGINCPKPDEQGWWEHGSTNRVAARFAPGYLAKYVSKGVKQWDTEHTGALPKGARMHGSGGLKGIALVELRWWLMPKWVRESVKWMGEARRVKGGWTCKQTGEVFETPFEVMFSRGMAWFRRKSPASCTSPERTPSSVAANASSYATCAWA